MKELTLRNGRYYIGDKPVHRGADVAEYSVFYQVADFNEVNSLDYETTSFGQVYFVDDNMDIKFSVRHVADYNPNSNSIFSEALAVNNG